MANSENITLRSVKGLPLSYAEADLNFTELQNLIIDFESLVSTVYPAQQQQINDVVQDMGELLMNVSDAIELQDQKIDNIEVDYGNLNTRVNSLEIANADYTNIFIRLDEHDLDIEAVNERVDLIDDALDGKQPLSSVLTDTTASFTTELKDKLDAIAVEATKNQTDAYLLDRANHKGTQDASTITGLTKDSVGLSNVDNTSDMDKPISTATQNALDAKAAIDLSNVSQSDARAKVGTGTMAYRNVTISTSNPSGGANGDIWLGI